MSVDPRSLAILQPEEQVLSTLNRDGSRCWLRPRLSAGRFLTARRWTAYGLIALFAAMPAVQCNGRPLMLLDVVGREFTFFGHTFLPTDTYLLALLLLSVVIGILLFTALLGRIWCGWACPQTVYLEFLYRPIERFFDGTVGKGGRPRSRSAIATPLKYVVYLAASVLLANIFLAYFVGLEALLRWVQRSPLEHPGSFLLMLATTGLMLFNFAYFREQTCLVACPYGRLQSVLLDRDSLIISYDEQRGEPRGKLSSRTDRSFAQSATAPSAAPAAAAMRSSAVPAVNAENARLGDCIDCNLCVVTCPTGIDIRKGLQMECVGCAQCIDACDDVMLRINRPRGLIRYTSQKALAGAPTRLVRGRTLYYSAGLALLVPLLVGLLLTRAPASVQLIRGVGLPFNVLPDDSVSNPLQIKLTNRSRTEMQFSISIESPSGAHFATAVAPLTVAPGRERTESLLIVTPRSAYVAGHAQATLRIEGSNGFEKRVMHELLGPGLRVR